MLGKYDLLYCHSGIFGLVSAGFVDITGGFNVLTFGDFTSTKDKHGFTGGFG